jgi:hypothetical protein
MMNKYDILEHYLQSLREERDDPALDGASSDEELRQVLKFARDLKVLTSSESARASDAFVQELGEKIQSPEGLREASRSLIHHSPLQEQEVGFVIQRHSWQLWKLWTPAVALVVLGILVLSTFQSNPQGGVFSFVPVGRPLSRIFSPTESTTAPSDAGQEAAESEERPLPAVNESVEDSVEESNAGIEFGFVPRKEEVIATLVPLDVSNITSLSQEMNVSLASLKDGMTEMDAVSSDTTLTSFASDFVVDF